ncbi:unnamed protein product, partial [Larinioides sclopetarius]
MSLLCVQVKRAALVGNPNQFNTYVTLKLQNVKSTTTSVKGNEPEWEVDFIFETNRMDIGLIIEVWNKGMLWDKLLGLQWLPLTRIKYTNEMGEGQWLSLDQELVMQDGEIVGTKVPTGHSLLLEAHFELPCDIEDLEEEELVKKLDYLNALLGNEISSLREQDRRHNFSLNSGISEDSDYTSDVSYPTVQHPSASVHHPNSSASQFGGAAEITRRASEYPSSRNGDRAKYIEAGNSYETDYDNIPYNSRDRNDYMDRNSIEDPLYYNSRPNRRMNSHSTDRSRSTRSTSGYDNSLSLDYESDMRYSFETDQSSRHCHWDEDTIDNETDKKNLERFQRTDRRRSLERQTGFDESIHDRFVEHYNPDDYGYRDSTETYPQSSFESYPSFRDDSVSTDWEKGSRYTTSYSEQDSYYMTQWEGEPEQPPPPTTGKVSGKYVPEESRTDWSKVNGTVGGRSGRHAPESEEWRNDSTGNDWKKRSLESEWSKESPVAEWRKEDPPHDWSQETTTPVIKVPKHGKKPWVEEMTPVAERVPPEPGKPADRWGTHPVEPAKDIDQWNGHPPKPTKDVDQWSAHPVKPAKDPDRWNSHPEPAKEVDRWNSHPTEPAADYDRWKDQPAEPPAISKDRWSNKTLEPVKPVERRGSVIPPVKIADKWNDHPAEVKNGDRWNNQSIKAKNGERWNAPVEPNKKEERWNAPVEPNTKEERWDSNGTIEPVRNAERWKNSEAKNGWSEETIVQEDWADEDMSNHQMDALISEWQEDNERDDWLPEEEEYEKEMPKPEYPEIQVNEPPGSQDDLEIEPIFKPPPPPTKEPSEYETSLTLTAEPSEADRTRDRRASVLSAKGPIDVPLLDLSMMSAPPEVPQLPLDDSDPTMSRAKRRWINAFNKIVAQLNEVRFFKSCFTYNVHFS